MTNKQKKPQGTSAKPKVNTNANTPAKPKQTSSQAPKVITRDDIKKLQEDISALTQKVKHLQDEVNTFKNQSFLQRLFN